MAPGTTVVEGVKTTGVQGPAWGGVTGTVPRPTRGPDPIGAGVLVLKRSIKFACGTAGCPGGDIWPGGSEAKMSEASKSFAEDLAVLLPLPGLVLCGGGIMAMES